MEDTLKNSIILKKYIEGIRKKGSLIERITFTVKLMKLKKNNIVKHQRVINDEDISQRELDFNNWVKTLNVSSRHSFERELSRGYVSRN